MRGLCFIFTVNSKKQKKITVLHIIDSLPREGAEVLLYDLIQRGDRRRFSYLVCVLTRGGGVADMLKEIDVPVYVLGRRSFWDLPAFGRLARLIKNKNVDIVHTHLFSSHLWGRLAGLLNGRVTTFGTEHNMSEWKGSWRRVADYLSAFFTERIIAVSLPVKNSLISVCRITPEKVVVVKNGLNLDRFPARVNRKRKLGELNLKEEGKLVGMAAALTPKKGHRYFIEAASRIAREREDTCFLLLGEGELRERIEEMIRARGLRERVLLLGSRTDPLEIISLLDVFVLSSVREGLSLALLEAMALGKATVATAVGGTPELIENGVSGLLVPPGDVDALREAIERILDRPELGKKLGRAARETVVKNYNFASTVRAYEKMYLASRISR